MAHSPECGHDHCELSNKCSCSHCMHRPGVPHPQPLLPGYLSWSVLMHAECSVKTPCMDINSSSPFKYLLHMRHYRVPKKGFILSLSLPFFLWFFSFSPSPSLVWFCLFWDKIWIPGLLPSASLYKPVPSHSSVVRLSLRHFWCFLER